MQRLTGWWRVAEERTNKLTPVNYIFNLYPTIFVIAIRKQVWYSRAGVVTQYVIEIIYMYIFIYIFKYYSIIKIIFMFKYIIKLGL